MAPNFIACDRDQPFLMPPSLLDWVPEGHLVWTILGSVDEMDLSAFDAAYRADGHGRPAYDPAMMVALLDPVGVSCDRPVGGEVHRRGYRCR
jgi:transposase